MLFIHWITFGVVVVSTVVVLIAKTTLRSYQSLKELPNKDLLIPRGYTLEELEEFDGVRKPLAFMGVKGVIYSVSLGFYGKDAPYNAFAGRDSSRQLGKTVVGRQECNADWSKLSAKHINVLQDWEDKLRSKYTPVGWVIGARETLLANAETLEP